MAQISSGGLGANPLDTINKIGRTPTGMVPAPAAFSGAERPDAASFTMTEALLSLPGRGLDVDLNLTYDSRLYQVNYYGQLPDYPINGHLAVDAVRGDNYSFPYEYLDAVKGFPAYGFALGYGALVVRALGMSCSESVIPPTASCIGAFEPPPPIKPPESIAYVDSSGSVHDFSGPADGSNLRHTIESGTRVITQPDGTKIFFGIGIQFFSKSLPRQEWFCPANGISRRTCTLIDAIFYPTKIIDTQGNFITITYIQASNPLSFGGPHIKKITDTMGREINFNYDNAGANLLSITAPGFAPNTTREIVRFYYAGLTRQHSFANQSSPNENLRTISHIWFPSIKTGVRYSYSTYGMIWKVERLRDMEVAANQTITAGTVVAYTEYNYPKTPSNLNAQVPTFTKRSDWWLESTFGVVETNFSVAAGPDPKTVVTTITAPDGAITETTTKRYTPQDREFSVPFDEGMVLRVKVRKGTTEFSDDKLEWEAGPRLMKKFSSLDGGPYKKVEFEYYTPPTGSPGVRTNPTKVREFGFDGVEVRRTEVAYKNHQNAPDYISGWLVSLPETVEVYDSGTNTLVSKYTYEYDTNPGLAFYDNIPQYQIPTTTVRGNCTRVTTNTNAATPAQGIVVTTYNEYDMTGNIVQITDPNGFVSQVGFSADYGYAYPTSGTSAIPDPNTADGISGSTIALTSETTYNFNTGLPTSRRDPNGQTTSMEYNDPALRPTRTISPAGGGDIITEYSDGAGAVSVKVKRQLDADTWEEGIHYFDSQGRTVKSQSSDARGNVFTETVYDNMGRVLKTSLPYRSSETVRWVENEYDALGRTKKIFSPSEPGQTVAAKLTSDFSGNALGAVSVGTNAAGKAARSIKDAFGRVIRVDEPNAQNELGAIDTPNLKTEYKYDVSNKLRRVTQGSQSRYFFYDSLGRLIRVRQPEQDTNPDLTLTDPLTNNSAWSIGYSYDANGNLKTMTDAKGAVTTYEYDQLNRLIKKSYTHPQTTDVKKITFTTSDVTFKYDGVLSPSPGDPNPSLVAMAKGGLTETSNGVSTTQRTVFDNLGRVTASRQITDGQVYSFSYEYNLGGALISETYPSGRVVTNDFDASGDLSAVKSNRAGQSEQTYASDFQYEAGGHVSQLKLGNQRWETYKLNARDQLTQIALGTSATDTSLWKVQYDYGRFNANGTIDASQNDGNVIRQTITISPYVSPYIQTYTYDTVNRLSEAVETRDGAQTWKQTFGYDRFGNRNAFTYLIGQTAVTLNNVNNPTIDDATNRIQTSQGYEYDLNGNLILDAQGRKFSFDANNKQREVKNSSQSVIGTYSYDGDGRRVKSTVGPSQDATIFVYDLSGKLVGEYSGLPSPGGTTYITSDILNSPRVLMNSNGDVISRRDFMPFGEKLLTSRSLPDKYGVPDGLRKSFTGYEKDEETDLDFAEARYYNDVHGRFTSVDPLIASGKSSNPQSFNRYVYAGNNPTLRTDQTGEIWYYWYETKLYGYLSQRVMYYKWITGKEPVPSGAQRVKSHLVNFNSGNFIGAYVLDPWEGRQTKVSSMEEAQAQIERYRMQAILNWAMGALEAASLSVEISAHLLGGLGVERDSEMYLAGQNSGIIAQGVAAGLGVGFTNALVSKFGKASFKVVRSLKVINQLCFVAGTPIHTDSGLKLIEDIKPGDRVLSWNESKKVFEYQSVVQIFRNQATELMKVTISHEKQQIVSTLEHPFYVNVHKSRNNLSKEDDGEIRGNWVAAVDLRVGDQLLRANGSWETVNQLEKVTRSERVYNFEVAENHNYFVGTTGVLAHNECKLALGFATHLDDFARQLGAVTFKNAPDQALWKQWIFDALSNPSTKVYFNLDGGVDVWAGVQRAAAGMGGGTDWELLLIKQNPQWWDRIEWIKDGLKVPNPFK
jgi:RHS repeat-associated protein